MKIAHVPKIDALYWCLLSLASVFGANASDVLADVFGLARPTVLACLLCVLHAAGSAAGDLFAHEVLSLALSTFVFGVSFGMVLTAMRILPRGDIPS